MIKEFQGKYRWLSNFYSSPMTIDDKFYSTVEHYFQACKAGTEKEHETIRLQESSGKAKRAGRKLKFVDYT